MKQTEQQMKQEERERGVFQHGCGGYYVATIHDDGSHGAPDDYVHLHCYQTPNDARRAAGLKAQARDVPTGRL